MLLMILSAYAHAGACDAVIDRESLLIGVENSAPFAMKGQEWEGLSVALWEKIAEQEGWNYTYVPGEFHQMLDDVANCKLDVVLPGITITAEREVVMNFTPTYYVEDVAIATNIEKSIWTLSGEIFLKLGKPILILLSILGTVGTFYYLWEKGKDRTFNGFFDSYYWAMTTLSTVGYGDESPKRIPGKLVAMSWMFVAMFVYASVNAQVLSAFQETSWVPEVDDLSDLKGRKVLTVSESYSDSLLSAAGVPHQTVETEDEMYVRFKNREVEFLVYDRSILKYHLDGGTILERGFHDQHLGFAVRPSAPFQEKLNQAVLRNVSSEWWDITTFRYLH